MTQLSNLSRSLAIVFFALVFGGSSFAAITFEDLLDEGALKFIEPEGFTEVQPEANPILPYERALRHPEETLEIRYVIRPIARATVEYEDPHNAAPDPNHLYAMMFRTLVEQLAAGGQTPLREYSTEQAHEQFNADWAAAAAFDVTEGFSSTLSQGLLIAMHKDQQADAYVIFLYDDYASVKAAIKQNMSTLQFR